MLIDVVLPTLKYNLRLANRICSLPFKWDEKNERIILIPGQASNARKWRLKFGIILHGLYVIYQVSTIITCRNDLLAVDKFVAGLILTLNAFLFGLRLELEPDYTPADVLNRIISGDDASPSIKSSLVKVLKVMCILARITVWGLPASLAAMSVLNRCKPPLIGSWLLCQTHDSLLITGIWTGLIFGAEFAFTQQAATGALHYGIVPFPLVAVLWGNCQLFLKSGKQLTSQEAIRAYRESQVAEKILNSCFRGRILPLLVLVVPLLQILSGVAFISVFHSAHWMLVGVFMTTFVDSAVSGPILLSAGSLIYSRTQDWISKVKLGCGSRKTYLRKVHMSLFPLKLEFAGNYLDRLTPLVVQEFCWRQTASMLLLSRLPLSSK